MLFKLFAVVAALDIKGKIPFGNEVFIGDRSYGNGSEMEPMMNQCFSEIYAPPANMGIIKKGTTVKVKGSEVVVKLHMRGRCESYGHFDYQIGHCHAQHSSESDIIDADYVTEHTIQSFEIRQCTHEESKAASKAASNRAAEKAARAKAEAEAAIAAATR